MSLNSLVSAERPHIGFFGLRNAGKSSIVNAVTGQNLAVVSDVKGTTTDPVKKAMELLPLGPVVIIDTPGLDDEGELGLLRVEKARRVLAMTDIAVLVVDGTMGLQKLDEELLEEFSKRKIPHVVVCNKADLMENREPLPENAIYASAKTGENIHTLKEMLGAFARSRKQDRVPVSDLLETGDVVVLVTPIDESAPKGRLILPQQLVIRDILDHHCIPVLCQVEQLAATLQKITPKLVITDSQAFGPVSKIVPNTIPLTSFSILMARYKGDLATLVNGAAKLSQLRDGDKVLICEGCTHHRQCGDIGTVKLPAWIKRFSGADFTFHFTSGGDFPQDLSQYALIVHCGGCMLNEQEMGYRMEKAREAEIPIVNYGVAIAQVNGILPRSLESFPKILDILGGTV